MSNAAPLLVRVVDVDNARDVAQLCALRFAWRANERDEVGLSEEEFEVAFTAWLREHRDSHVGFLATEHSAAIAMAWLAVVDRVPGPGVFERRCAYVQSVYVTPERRNRGVGGVLMSQLIDHARFMKLDYLAVHPSAPAFGFYRRLGFSDTDKVLELDFRDASSA